MGTFTHSLGRWLHCGPWTYAPVEVVPVSKHPRRALIQSGVSGLCAESWKTFQAVLGSEQV